MRRIAVGAVSALLLSFFACTSEGGYGAPCEEDDDCEGVCSGSGYCTTIDCTPTSCPSGWKCVVPSTGPFSFGPPAHSSCYPPCSACPAGTTCTSSHPESCERPHAEYAAPDAGTPAVAACTAHAGERCTKPSDCCDGECALERHDRSYIPFRTCVLRCPTACTTPGWACQPAPPATYPAPPPGEYCLPSPPVVTITQSPPTAKLGSEVVLTATAASAIDVVDFAWVKYGSNASAGQNASVTVTIAEPGERYFVTVRDDANQTTTATFDVVTSSP